MSAKDRPQEPRVSPLTGTRAKIEDAQRRLLGRRRIKHDPNDKTSKDWANSEPDPDAP